MLKAIKENKSVTNEKKTKLTYHITFSWNRGFAQARYLHDCIHINICIYSYSNTYEYMYMAFRS